MVILRYSVLCVGADGGAFYIGRRRASHSIKRLWCGSIPASEPRSATLSGCPLTQTLTGEDFTALFAYKDSIILCDIIAIVYIVNRAGLYCSTLWQCLYLAAQAAYGNDIIAPVINPRDVVRSSTMRHVWNDFKHVLPPFRMICPLVIIGVCFA